MTPADSNTPPREMTDVNAARGGPVYRHLFAGMERFGVKESDICRLAFQCDASFIRESVVLTPMWEPDSFLPYTDKITPLAEFNYRKVWDVSLGDKKISFIRTGIGAPAVCHAVFALSASPCSTVLFIGAAGGIVPGIQVGDLIIPEYSVCGDGSCRYITTGSVKGNDCFGQKYYPNREISLTLSAAAKLVPHNENHRLHSGKTFSVDNLFAEFAHLEEILDLGCDTIEMETAALFLAAETSGIRAGALFSVSDNSFSGKSLYAGRTPEDEQRRSRARHHLIPKIILETLKRI
jgi:uridine phosphorylase